MMVVICMAAVLTGCDAPKEEKPIWQQVKISDLAPFNNVNNTSGRLLKTVNLNIRVFEVPSDSLSAINDIWQMLYKKPLEFNDYDAFCANSFLVGFGQTQMWDIIASVLRSVGGKQIKKVSLLLPDGETNDFTITKLDKKQDIFYISSAGLMEGVTLGPGKLALRIKVEKIPGSRGVCKVNAQPVFPTPVTSPIPRLAAQAKSAEFLFTSSGFCLKMSPGDFILLGPEKYIEHQITLGSLFFSKPKPRPIVRIILLFCTRIID